MGEYVKGTYEPEATLCSRKYVVDAKSILGIFSLDLTKPLILNLYGINEDKNKDFIKN